MSGADRTDEAHTSVKYKKDGPATLLALEILGSIGEDLEHYMYYL